MTSDVLLFEDLGQAVNTLFIVSGALTVVVLILAVALAVNISAVRKLSSNYRSFMLRKDGGGISIEQLLNDCLDETRAVAYSSRVLSQRCTDIESRLPYCFQKIGVVRYNPFQDTGGDLSYAIALLDAANSGFILNGIYNRSGSYTYAKEISNGIPTKHKLSAEENEALQLAIGNTAERRRNMA